MNAIRNTSKTKFQVIVVYRFSLLGRVRKCSSFVTSWSFVGRVRTSYDRWCFKLAMIFLHLLVTFHLTLRLIVLWLNSIELKRFRLCSLRIPPSWYSRSRQYCWVFGVVFALFATVCLQQFTFILGRQFNGNIRSFGTYWETLTAPSFPWTRFLRNQILVSRYISTTPDIFVTSCLRIGPYKI